MKPATIALLLTPILAVIQPRDAAAQDASAYVITDATTGYILEERNGDKKLQIASLTKVATAMVVIDWGKLGSRDLKEQAVIPRAALQLQPNQVGWVPGDRCALRDLLYAALMQSDNIAAYALAEHVAASLPSRDREATAQDRFVAQMNALARKLDMERTLFTNPHGLDQMEKKAPYSTAADLAKLAAYAMSDAGFRFYVSQKERKIEIERFDGTKRAFLLRNTNELLGIDAIDGVKTGTTRRAGQCLMLSAARPPETIQNGPEVTVIPRRINVVVLNAPRRFETGNQLMARGWGLFERWAAAGRPNDQTARR
jgi:D-alanyl-D-alanine carboxypeptidase